LGALVEVCGWCVWGCGCVVRGREVVFVCGGVVGCGGRGEMGRREKSVRRLRSNITSVQYWHHF